MEEDSTAYFVADGLDCFEEEIVPECEQTPAETSIQTDPIERTCECSLPHCECNCHGEEPALPEEPKTYVNDFVDDPEGLKFNTGFDTLPAFFNILHCLGPAAYQLKYWQDVKPELCVPDQLLLTLMKLRTYKPNSELSHYFSVSEDEVFSVFVTWVRFMSLQWRELDLRPKIETVRFYAPAGFREKFPNTHLIIDKVEIPVKKPSKPNAQHSTLSASMKRSTAKALIGITPGGLVSYVSDCYSSSTSDQQILADGGFNVQDLCGCSDVIINIPTFWRKKNHVCSKTVLRDRHMSSVRTHVKQVIDLAKTYKILCNPLNTSEAQLSSDILFICFMLVNFQPCVVPKDA